MSDLTNQILDTAKIVILAALLVVGIQYVFAWSGPPAGATPPACPSGQPGCDAPVNVSNNLQVKLGDLGVRSFTADNTQINGTLNVLSAITATAGTFSGAITGGSLNVGAGAVTAGQGTFAGGVTVGTSDGTFEYLQLDNKSSLGGFQEEDCNVKPEGGRMFYDSSIGILYLCVQGRTTVAENGWKPVSVEYVPTQR